MQTLPSTQAAAAAAAPTFSPAGGTYTAAQTVTLSSTTSGASIRYTTDGSTPSDTAGTLYTGPITVSGTTTIKAVAYASGLTNSTVSTATYTIRAVAPGFSPAGGTFTAAQTVTLSSTTSGASIRYTTDGSTPSDTAGTLYTGPITVSGTTTIKAVAYASGLTNSTVSTATYTIRAVAPGFSPAGGTFTAAQTVTLSSTTSGAAIRYTTDGSTPSDTAGTPYTGPITVSGTTTIKAVAYASGLTNSTVSTATYTIRAVAPSFSPAGGTYTAVQTVTLSTTTSGAAIRYTTDSSTPSDTAGTPYTGPITVRGTTTIKALAYASGLTNSTVSTATYTIRAVAPSFSPAGGTYTAAQTVTLSSTTSGALIRYTTDGSTPSDTAGTPYTGPITVSGTTTIKAVAYASGLTNSTVSTATYTIRAVAPSFSPAGGTYTAAQTVTLSSTTSGASIRYTTDGSTPSDTAGTPYTGPITVSGTTTIQAVAYASGLTNSTVSTATYTIRAAAPSFSPAGGTYTAAQTVTLSNTTSGASIRYTTDGSTPSETAGTLYAAPFAVSGTSTVKAIAYASGLTNSTVSTATYTIRAVAPGFSPAGGTYTAAQTVTLSSTTSGASIRYTTDGSTPSDTAGTPYTGPITVSGTTTIQAVAYSSGSTNSTVSTATYTIRAVAPSFSPAGGTYTAAQMVTLSTTSVGASINYTTDGSTPSDTAGTLYAGPITVSGTTTIKAVAYASGLTNSTVSTATYTIRTQAPGISSLSPTSGPVGAAVSIAGSNFGANQGSSTVTFNGVSAGTASIWGATGITVTVPGGASTGNVVVTVNGLASNGVSFTVTVPPSISSLSPSRGPVGGLVTLVGSNFGDSQGSSTVTFHGVSADAASFWSATIIAVTVPSGASTGNVVVTVGGVASNGVNFTVQTAAPSISSVSPTTGVAGAQVAISGSGFGSERGTGAVWLGSASGTIVSWSDTLVVAKVASNATSGTARVQQDGVWSSAVAFDVATATISSVTPASGVPGDQVTIAGSGFGAAQGSGQVWLGTPNGVVQSWSDAQVVAVVAAGSASGKAQVLQNGVLSNPVQFDVNTLHVTGVSPTSGSPGTAVTFTGSGFGSSQGAVQLGSTGGQVLSWSETQVVAKVAPDALTGIARVQQGGMSSNAVAFTVVVSGGNSIAPNLLNLVVGDTHAIQALGPDCKPVTGLTWTSSDTNVVSLSSDDPPMLSALAAGHVTVTAGTASADVTVSADALPMGTVIWSNPGTGAGSCSTVPAATGSSRVAGRARVLGQRTAHAFTIAGVDRIAPAVPSPSGVADVFGFQDDGTVLAITSEGTTAWTADLSGAHYWSPRGVVPDFQGGLVGWMWNFGNCGSASALVRFDGLPGSPLPFTQFNRKAHGIPVMGVWAYIPMAPSSRSYITAPSGIRWLALIPPRAP